MLAPELEPPPRSLERPASMARMRAFGFAVMTAYVVASALGGPRAGRSGDGLLVSLCCLTLGVSFVVIWQARVLPPGVRVAGLCAITVAGLGLIELQRDGGSAIAGVYFVVVIAALRLPRRQAIAVTAFAMVTTSLAYALWVKDPSGQIISILTGVPPWFFVMRVMIELRRRQADALDLVEQLKDSREAQAAAATEAERARVARELHDVLAHSLAGLSIQLEAARMLAGRRGADPDLVAHLERAHGLAAAGLEEARRAIGALRGEALPGAELLPALVASFGEEGGPTATLDVEGTARPLASDAQLALFRTAQEALTNVRKHAGGATRVTVRLAYAPDATTLEVTDRGARVAVPARGGGQPGGGYGLTGMRERAELLGGRLDAGPTRDGFRVALRLPA